MKPEDIATATLELLTDIARHWEDSFEGGPLSPEDPHFDDRFFFHSFCGDCKGIVCAFSKGGYTAPQCPALIHAVVSCVVQEAMVNDLLELKRLSLEIANGSGADYAHTYRRVKLCGEEAKGQVLRGRREEVVEAALITQRTQEATEAVGGGKAQASDKAWQEAEFKCLTCAHIFNACEGIGVCPHNLSYKAVPVSYVEEAPQHSATERSSSNDD